jgi:hypothetical protein
LKAGDRVSIRDPGFWREIEGFVTSVREELVEIGALTFRRTTVTATLLELELVHVPKSTGIGVPGDPRS